MANEFPQLSDVFALDKQVTYKEAVEQVWLPQDNAILSVPSASPIETLTLSAYTITPTVALGAITYASGTTAELHFIDYSNLRDGAIIQIRILDNTYPITIKNGITGNGGIFTSNGEDILLSDYRKIVQLQREGSIWRQVGTIQSANLPITNCLTEIPQDIKLELVDGTLTLKAGSKVYVPNGFEDDGVTPKFDVVVIESDSTIKNGANRQEIILSINGEITGGVPSAWAYSGATQPTVSTTFAIWYDTANNKIKQTNNNGSTWVDGLSLPIALSTSNTAQYTSIDQVFNGFGYIGSTVYALPSVKGLIPNGRNEDGSLKNIEFTVDRVRPQTFTSADNFPEVTYWLTSTGEFGGANVNINYHSNINKVLYDVDGTSRAYCNAGGFAVMSGKITSLTPKLPFRAVDYNDMQLKQDEATAVNYDNITNCLTEIPQDIKLELNNGTLTLKAGSKVYVPNGKNTDGSNKFDEVVIASDVIKSDWSSGDNGIYLLFLNIKGSYLYGSKSQASGTSTSAYGGMYYRTEENYIYPDNNLSNEKQSLPICSVYLSNGSITSIDQVFNGFGYIGSTVFALPNVKGLIPNGRNEDGSLRNEEFAIRNVSIMDTSSVDGGSHTLYLHKNTGLAVGSYWEYDKEINGFKHESSYSYGILCEAGETQLSNGVITSFSPKTAFHAADYQDVALKQNFQVVSTLPSSPQPDVFYFIPE